jgi:hypothetical protein
MTTAHSTLAIGTISPGMELAYVIALVLSGLLLVIVAGTGLGGQGVGMRILNAAIGLAFLGYAFWIFFLSKDGDTIRILFYVFIVPIALVVQVFRNRRATT